MNMYHQHDNHGYWTLSTPVDNNNGSGVVAIETPKGQLSSMERPDEVSRSPTVAARGTSGTLERLPGGATESPGGDDSHTMHNGLVTTVPQSMVQHKLDFRHRPLPRRSRHGSSQGHNNCCMRCCHVHVLLVVTQLLLGGAITALAFYMETLAVTIALRDCPYWAGIPLLTAGILGVYFCATNFTPYSSTMKAFTVKAMCFTVSSGCTLLCMIACVFCAIHTARITSFMQCESAASTCYCVTSNSPQARLHLYEVTDCEVLRTSVKNYLILLSAFNFLASIVSFWFIALLWKARYGGFHSGLRFYSYNATLPPHP